MQFLVDFFNGFKEFFTLAWDFLSSIIDGIGQIIKLIPHLTNQLVMYVHMIPPVISGTAGIIMIISIVYLIIGRNTGES